jgi:hypothetical protein
MLFGDGILQLRQRVCVRRTRRDTGIRENLSRFCARIISVKTGGNVDRGQAVLDGMETLFGRT